MHYLSKPTWETHPSLTSSHIITCARCKTTAPEAGVIEAYTVQGELHIAICSNCLVDFISFTTKQGEQMKSDCEFSEEALAGGLDIDIAAHHPLCECYECLVDPDQYYKFQRENDMPINHRQERSA